VHEIRVPFHPGKSDSECQASGRFGLPLTLICGLTRRPP